MEKLYTLDEIIKATGGRAENITAQDISSISIDSREIEKGALYVAIKGDRFDGHDFVKAAIKNGAVVALVAENHVDNLSGLPIIIVSDPLKALMDIAIFARSRTKAKIIAVTGSAGKTSTKEILREVLSEFGKTHASIKSFNNHWGVPLMLARMAKNTEYGVFEIGMNHAGEISPLVKMVKPDIAIITNVAPAHLAQLGSLENIAKAKGEIFDGLKKDGTAIINIDHEQRDILLDLAKKANVFNVITYGFNEKANVRIVGEKVNKEGMNALVCWSNMELNLKISNFGKHRLANASVVLIVAKKLNLDLNKTLKTIEKMGEPEGRGKIYKFGDENNPLILIDETYNANPLSVSLTLNVFKDMKAKSGQKILILADMLELGEKSDELHIALKDDVLAVGANKIYLIGKSMGALANALKVQKNVISAKKLADIQETIIKSLDFGDVIMLKGSNGMKLGELVKEIRTRFDVK